MEYNGNDPKEPDKSKKLSLHQRGNDYYEWMGSAKEVRPIAVTEGVEWHTMSNFGKLVWCNSICIQMLSLTIFSLRTDRLVDVKRYMKYHWKHYSGSVLKGLPYPNQM